MTDKLSLPERKIIAVYARDWSIDDGPTDINHAFSLYHAWVIGFLIRETRDSITLAPEIFDNRIRRSQTIPKSAIIKKIEIKKPFQKI